MSKKICISSVRSVGCTFIDWSIHFLSGQTHYYNVALGQWIELVQSPLSGANAHNHDKNHPPGAANTELYINHLDSMPANSIYSMYAQPIELDVATKQLNFSVEELDNIEKFSLVAAHIRTDYNKIFNVCHQHKIKIVFVSIDPEVSLYFQNTRCIEQFMFRQEQPNSTDELRSEYQKVFFKYGSDKWSDTNLWDTREKLALDIRPFDQLTNYKPDIQHPYLNVNASDLWAQTVSTIKKIMSYLELEINSDRLERWLPICSQWQQIQLDLLEFTHNQPHIVNAIVNNQYYEIDLTFDQEVVIQHCLIYQHGLNLKTWQLEKFPNNTQDLHKLLEPNIHQVPKIY